MSDLPKDVRTKKLTQGQVTMYAAHPRLDLFVDANSPHPMQQFGCTICHAGQGSATEFVLASHAPADYHQEHDWEKRYDWKAIHYWDYPMYSKPLHRVELPEVPPPGHGPGALRQQAGGAEGDCAASTWCARTAASAATRSPAPRPAAPSARTCAWNRSPPLDWMTPSEQEKAQADTLNPPGTYRKVGPSLRRIAEKTNQEWARQVDRVAARLPRRHEDAALLRPQQ